MEDLQKIISDRVADAVKAGQPEEEALRNVRSDMAAVIWELEFELETRQGLDDLAAGRTVPDEKVQEWVDSWGTDNELPMPTAD